jgi:hypothetical protein
MKPTPGPWFARKMFSGSWDISAEDGDGKTIARTEKESDARLIAAVPELLEALKEQIEPRAKGWKVTDWDIRDENARAAIAKAKERTPAPELLESLKLLLKYATPAPGFAYEWNEAMDKARTAIAKAEERAP